MTTTETTTNESLEQLAETTQLQAGDFIYIPAWETYGQVIAIEPAWYGSPKAQRVLVQDAPEQAGRWYTLEPGEYQID